MQEKSLPFPLSMKPYCCMCVYVDQFISVFVCMWISSYLCLCVCGSVHICVCVYVDQFISVFVCMWISSYLCLCVCGSVHICICVCVRKVNGCKIAYRKAKYNPSLKADPVANLSSEINKLTVSPPPAKSSTDGSADEVVQVKRVGSLSSAPPPNLQFSTQPPMNLSGPSPVPPNTSITSGTGTSSSPYPMSGQPAPPPQATSPPTVSNYLPS